MDNLIATTNLAKNHRKTTETTKIMCAVLDTNRNVQTENDVGRKSVGVVVGRARLNVNKVRRGVVQIPLTCQQSLATHVTGRDADTE